jgi:protein-disulfide isomerase
MPRKNKIEEKFGGLGKNLHYILLGIVILTIVNTVAWFSINGKVNSILSGSSVETGGEVQTSEPTQEDEDPSGNQVNFADDDEFKGSEDAPITIVEFSDYECPYCNRFFTDTLPQIQENYIDTGKVKFVYRDFPLSFHPNAQKAAEAAECAGEQGRYWEMHDKLFGEGVSGGVAAFKQYAAEIGLDTDEFNQCLDSGEMASEIQKDFADGQSLGVTGTPGFLINNIRVIGAQPYEVFEQVIEQELNK